MILSHKYRFIFIKNRKVAGTSAEMFLAPFCGMDDVITPFWVGDNEESVKNEEYNRMFSRNFDEGGFFNHMPAIKVREKVYSAIWDDYYKFCIERNPWDKVLSHYHMMRHRYYRKHSKELSLDEYLAVYDKFSDYLKYADADGDLLVDRVVKYENLNKELRPILNHLGIDFGGDFGVRAKSLFRTDSRHYRAVLTEPQARLISERFSREIKLLGYTY